MVLYVKQLILSILSRFFHYYFFFFWKHLHFQSVISSQGSGAPVCSIHLYRLYFQDCFGSFSQGFFHPLHIPKIVMSKTEHDAPQKERKQLSHLLLCALLCSTLSLHFCNEKL